MQNLLSLTNLLITLALVAGAWAAYQHGFARTADEVKARVISAMQHEIDALKDRLEALEKENQRLSQVISVIRSVLKQRGLQISIDGELVSIQDQAGCCTQATRIVEKEAATQSSQGSRRGSEREEEV